MCSLESDVTPMSNQAWKALLGLDFAEQGTRTLSGTSSGSSSGSTRAKKLQDMMRTFLRSCTDVEDVSLGDSGLTRPRWNGVDFESLQPSHFEQILWELAELNFRFELVALDVRMSGSEASERQRLIQECFPDCAEGGSLLTVKLEYADFGVASLQWEQKAKHLHGLKRLMMSWKGEKPSLFCKETAFWPATEIDALEGQVAQYYTQMFFDNFSHAPVIPRRLSNPARALTLVPRSDEPVMVNPSPLVYYDLSRWRHLKAQVR